MDFSAIDKKKLHHAYFLEGDYDILIPNLLEYLKTDNDLTDENILINKIPVIYIENSREIKNNQLMKSDGPKIIIIPFDRIILAAQHALLKTLEEPTENTHFFFINRNSNALLPTIKSRMLILKQHGRSETKNDDNLAYDYLTSDYYGRSELLKDLIAQARGEDDENDEEKASAKRLLVRFLDSLERILSEKIQSQNYEYAKPIEAIISAKRDLEDASPSIKIIFEHLALILPKNVKK